MKLCILLICFCEIIYALPTPTTLKIQDLITITLENGLAKKDINFNFQKSELLLLNSEANFDTLLTSRLQSEDSQAESMGLVSNDRDRINTWGLSLSRKFSTGTTLGLDYSFVHRDSDLSSYAISNNTSPVQYYYLTALNFKQELLNNTFGYKDQRTLQSAQFQHQRAKFERDEATEELVLQSIKLFLDTYFAQENLKQSIAARDKYILLVKSIQQKNKMGFDDRSELIKTRAELQNQERNVKSAILLHSNLLEKLYSLLNINRPEEVIIEIPEVLPTTNQTLTPPALDSLRKSQSTDLLVKSTLAEKESAINSGWVVLNFFAQAAYSGLDKANSTATTEMSSRENPKYTLGLEFAMKWGSSAQKAERLSKHLAHEEALNMKQKIHNDLDETLTRTERNLNSRYTVATHALETVKIWEEALKSQEKNHRFGRITTSELILDYTNYFRAKSNLSGALSDYQLSLFEYKAARDELIPSKN